MRTPHWLLVGLAVAAAGCPELGDVAPSSDRDADGVSNELDCAPDDPASWQPLTGYLDGDRDGHGAGGPLTLCAGAVLPYGYSTVGDDCDDAAKTVWHPAERFVDADGDLVGAGEPVALCVGDTTPAGFAQLNGDCAPGDATRWAEAGFLYRDSDLDGFTVPEAGVVCSGTSLPDGYRMAPSALDCDDGDRDRFALVEGYVDADRDSRGAGAPAAVCTGGSLPAGYAATAGDCAASDATRWQELGYSFVDLDGDGFTIASTGTVCTGAFLPAGYRTTPSPSGDDCDDSAAALHTLRYGYADVDADGFGAGTVQSLCSGASLPAGHVTTGTDCAPEDAALWRDYAYSQRDADLDGYTVAVGGSLCVGAQPPAGFGTVASSIPDCDDGDPVLYRSLGGYLDGDGDGYGVGPLVSVCTAGALPGGYVTNLTDCAGEDPTAWRSVASLYVDRDADGHTVKEAGPFCIGASPAEPYRETAAGNDCDESDPTLYRWVVLYADQDGDGVGAPPRWIPCLGGTLPDGWSIFGYDADDGDPAVASDPAIGSLLTVVD